jgi:predicted 3-demethylubiquinone-9 3-methyltransferase (glyoxalase superfamily)
MSTTPIKVRTCLWFEKDGEDAAKFYTALVPGSRIEGSLRPDQKAPALTVEFTLSGTPYQILNGGPQFKQTEAASISVTTPNQQETDRLWNALTDGGEESMCGWLKDRYGVSWQIVPEPLIRMLKDSDRAAADRAMQAMLKMRKIDVATLERAFAGK